MGKWAFIQHVTDYMRRPRMGDPRAPTLWPSEATAVIENEWKEQEVVGKCRRATYFRYLIDLYAYSPQYAHYRPLVESLKLQMTPVDSYLLWIWRAGELYEEYMVEAARDSGVWIASQVQVYVPEINLSGKIDIVTVNPDTSKLSIVEAKSVYGHNGNYVLGSPGERKKGVLGTPKDSNLMQIALYDWWYADRRAEFEESRLVYGARDTGRYAEYLVDTRLNPDTNITEIWYQGVAPVETQWVKSPITIDSIIQQYQYIQLCVDTGAIPDRDFELQYSDEKIAKLYERGELNKVETERVGKRLEQIKEGKAKINKQIEKGDWQCSSCQFQKICYDQEGNPRKV